MPKKLKENLTIDDFYIKSYVPWDEIEEVMGKRRHKKFMKWMMGQTCYEEGCYVHDLERYLNMEFRGKPTYFD